MKSFHHPLSSSGLDRRQWLKSAAAGCAAAGLPMALQAQVAYPRGPVTLLVPFPPGGLLDSVARIVAPSLGQSLGQPLVVENKPGSGGNIGAAAVAKAAADGQTLLLASPALTISPAIYDKLAYAPDDLVPVASLGSLPNVLLVPASSPARTVKDLLDQLKAKPGAYSYASNGNGTSLHLSMELLKFKTKTFALHVPYRGSGPAMTALISGDVQLMFDNLPPALAHIQSGRVRALAVTSARRSSVLPDVPTLQEAGVPDFDVTAWFGLMAPKGTPTATLRRLEADSAKAIAQADVAEALRKQGIEPQFQDASAFGQRLARERKQWQSVVDYAKIKMDS
ncbi:tripartite tricarboxylate transporter substrate binding protein [Aquincola tertiaricarbonis]|uniref:Tripartite tricarboxylate transporter substrate binding protein n=1 Tax=Aquincola tertiaricarbonis TaxID=391953 RepID=A0ABY4SA04_AQUTE|nr:tripartite tricarboxylate transporter substrate binding protein [Aquincola tertiaricarbonis]URI10192.1 tripartite tricarboxylate transporter substrate binding protein [Aquincola tertiaricarbonis]